MATIEEQCKLNAEQKEKEKRAFVEEIVEEVLKRLSSGGGKKTKKETA